MDDNVLGILAAIFLMLSFGVVIAYFLALISFMRSIKKNDVLVWEQAKSSAKAFESDLGTAFRVFSSIRLGSVGGIRVGVISLALSKAVKVRLYIGLACFMCILAIGLSISVMK